MKITVIGASRGIGKEVVNHSLSEGHMVTALVRDTSKMEDKENLTLIKGDILDYNSVYNAVKEKDVIVTSIGIGITFRKVTVFSEGIKNVIKAMEELHVKNLISVTGVGTGTSKGHGGFLYDKIFKPVFLGTIYADKEREEDLIVQSSLNWTIVRPGFLTNGKMKCKYRAVTDLKGITARSISRKDVAHFILNEAKTKIFSKKTPLLFY